MMEIGILVTAGNVIFCSCESVHEIIQKRAECSGLQWQLAIFCQWQRISSDSRVLGIVVTFGEQIWNGYYLHERYITYIGKVECDYSLRSFLNMWWWRCQGLWISPGPLLWYVSFFLKMWERMIGSVITFEKEWNLDQLGLFPFSFDANEDLYQYWQSERQLWSDYTV